MTIFIKFCLIGSVGYLVDVLILVLLVNLELLNPYFARLFSFLSAASTTWILNRKFTFRVTLRPNKSEWIQYVGLMVIGALINYAVFAILVFFKYQLWMAVAGGSVAGLSINFLSSKFLFTQKSDGAQNSVTVD